MSPAAARAALTRLSAEYDHVRRTAESEEAILAETKTLSYQAAAAQKILQEIAAGVQQSAHEQIARIVAKCLETVFDTPYGFRVVFEQKRGKTEARLAFVRDGAERDPLTECGGGVCDVAALGLRIAALMLARPAVRRLLVLDEPLKHLSRDHAPRIRELLEQLAADLELQIIVVTHTPQLACGKIVEIS